MKVGQRVRFKPTSRLAQNRNIPPEAQGTVTCSYRMPLGNRAAVERLDVRFAPDEVIWGGPAEEFEEVGASPDRTLQ